MLCSGHPIRESTVNDVAIAQKKSCWWKGLLEEYLMTISLASSLVTHMCADLNALMCIIRHFFELETSDFIWASEGCQYWGTSHFLYRYNFIISWDIWAGVACFTSWLYCAIYNWMRCNTWCFSHHEGGLVWVYCCHIWQLEMSFAETYIFEQVRGL